MALTLFPQAMNAAATAVRAVADTIRFMQAGSGDLQWSVLDRLFVQLADARAATVAALAEGQKAPAAAEAYMVSLNGPETLAAFQLELERVEAAVGDWVVLVADFIQSLSVENVMRLATVDNGGGRMFLIERVSNIAGSVAPALRDSPELAALLVPFEAVGA